MSDWKDRRLDDLVLFQRGHDLTQLEMIKGEYPVAGSNGIIDYHNEYTTEGPGITLGRSGNSIGVAHYYKSNFWAHNTTLYSKEFKDANPLFVYYFLRTIDFKTLNSGSAVPSLNRNHIHNIIVRVPSLPEQTAIASVLSSLDDKIDLLHSQNATLEKIAETLFRQWFVEEAKEEWEIESLGNIIEMQRGISYSGSSLCEKTEGIPMHNLNSIDINGSYKYEGIKYYKGKVKDNQILKPGDLLIINTDITQDNRIIGWPIFVPNEFEYSVSTHHIYSAQLKNQNVSKLYLYYLLRHRDYREELANAANGTTVSMLSKGAIEGINIKIPPKEKRIFFESQVSVFLKKQSENQTQILTLIALRDTLLPKLMSGEVRVEK